MPFTIKQSWGVVVAASASVAAGGTSVMPSPVSASAGHNSASTSGVTFMHYDLGNLDDETCRLEPIENPFEVLPLRSE